MGIVDSFPDKYLPLGLEGARVVILSDDEEIHQGERYTCLFYETVSASSGTSIVCITTNSNKEVHLNVGIDTTGAGVWMMSEDAIISSGTVLSAFNNNRQSSNTCDCIIVSNPSISTVGTIIGYHVIGSSTGGASKSGGSTTSKNEWILKKNTTYMFRYTTVTSNTQVSQGLYFYEGEY